MAVCNFQGQAIKSQQADAYKDAVFSSFLNIDYLKRLSTSHRHQYNLSGGKMKNGGCQQLCDVCKEECHFGDHV